jgi:DNA mismatch repair protein MutS
LDQFTARNLELVSSNHPQGKSLLEILDNTQTPMGARLLRKWLVMPLKDKFKIKQRLDTVDFGVSHPDFNKQVRQKLARVGDLERLITKVSLLRINPREIVALGKALELTLDIKQLCKSTEHDELMALGDKLNPCEVLIEKIKTVINPEPPMLTNKGDIFQSGNNAELDELRSIAFSGKDFLLNIQKREAERTSIPNLKIAYNNVFGYFLEVTNSHKDKVPGDWIRKQTLSNAERYITQELKEYEDKILTAEDKIYANRS